MKKRLSPSQFKELKQLGYKGGSTTGDLIEFMDQYGDYIYSKQLESNSETYHWTIRKRKEKQNKFKRKELCDTLYRAVKEKLSPQRRNSSPVFRGTSDTIFRRL